MIRTSFDIQLKHFLETNADLNSPTNASAIAGGAFSPEAIHRLRSIVRRYGRTFPTRHRDYPIPVEERKCFKYAQNMAMERGLGYVEGFALGNQCYRGALPGGLAFFHGWCIEKDGAVYDPQWRNYGAAYFGIEFTREYLTNRFNLFLKREQETGQPMIPFLCAVDFDESVADLHGAFAMVAVSSNCPHHAPDDPACRSCEILPVTGHRVLFLAADKRPDCKCVHPFGSRFICVCPNQRERYWPANSDAS
jgi:hypothetical protein